MAYISDSVPELVKRSMSSWNRSQKRSLISVACGDGVTKRVPVSVRASVTRSTTCGLRWPTSMAPNPMDRSSSRLPSTSVSHAPRADAMLIGYGSQCWNELVTPSGSDLLARSWCAPDPADHDVNRSHSAASSRSTVLAVDRAGPLREASVRARVVAGRGGQGRDVVGHGSPPPRSGGDSGPVGRLVLAAPPDHGSRLATL